MPDGFTQFAPDLREFGERLRPIPREAHVLELFQTPEESVNERLDIGVRGDVRTLVLELETIGLAEEVLKVGEYPFANILAARDVREVAERSLAERRLMKQHADILQSLRKIDPHDLPAAPRGHPFDEPRELEHFFVVFAQPHCATTVSLSSLTSMSALFASGCAKRKSPMIAPNVFST